MENAKTTGATASKAWTSDLLDKNDSPFEQGNWFQSS